VFNFLAGAARAIVDPAPGTTRDLVSERVDLEGFRVDLIDTAGIRDGADAVEAEGVARARRAAETAALVVLVLDRSRPLGPEDRALLGALDPARRIVAVNKIDLPAAWDGGAAPLAEGEAVLVSMKTGEGAGALRSGMVRALEGAEGSGPAREHAAVTNIRHVELLRRAHTALARARESVAGPGPAASDELVLADLQEARSALEEITGTRTTEDLLEHIFSRFCVGK
jgi:tRNA modification GTPase